MNSTSTYSSPYLTGIFDGSKFSGTDYDFLVPIIEFINQFILPITITLVIMGVFLAIFIGIAIAKAESSSKAAELKKRMVGIIVTIVVCIALFWLLGWLFSALPTIVEFFKGPIMSNLPGGGISANSSSGISSTG